MSSRLIRVTAVHCRLFAFQQPVKPSSGSWCVHPPVSSSGGTTLLRIPVSEHRPFPGDTVNVGCPVSHNPMVVGADVVPDVVPPQRINMFGFLSAILLILPFNSFWLSDNEAPAALNHRSAQYSERRGNKSVSIGCVNNPPIIVLRKRESRPRRPFDRRGYSGV